MVQSSEISSSFSPSPSGKATWPEPRTAFRKANVKGSGRATLLSCPRLLPHPGLAPQPRARRTEGQPPGSHSGNIHSYCHRAKQESFLSSETILETPVKKTCFSYWLTGLKRDPCLPGSGRTQAPRKVSLPAAATPTPHPPRSAAPRPLSRAQRPPSPLGAHSRQPPPGGLVLQ